MGVRAVAMRRAVFLDRDGVLNGAVVRDGRPYPPARLEDVEILPRVREACLTLRAAGFLLIVVTNQPDVARGTRSREVVEAIHRRLQSQMPLDDVRVCYHDDADGCACRKPRPGLLLDAAAAWGIDLSRSYMVGDRYRDVEAGRRAGCTTILIGDAYAERPTGTPDAYAATLSDAAAWILTRGAPTGGRSLMKTLTGLEWKARTLAELSVKIFADGADVPGMLELYRNPHVRGFTTNPTLMRKAGITDYRAFAREVLQAIPDRPISFEVFSDDFEEMERQALEIAGWGENVYVKIPITNTREESSRDLVAALARRGVKVNVTAILAIAQVEAIYPALAGGPPSYISVFAGRIADTGRDPMPIMAAAVELLRPHPNIELIWASPRELLNIFHADAVGCHVITATHDLLKKLDLAGRDLHEYSLDTVRMFFDDAQKAGYVL